MDITSEELRTAREFIRKEHGGDIEYNFGNWECARMMAKYLKYRDNEV